ncbi:hypothetical protein BOTBODRAFT_42136 [Botryobasidium botryosum FD-172 SS1]|uniref:Uncharacterized protein n=1 Tax=Botryobasidium botryosum (strain FD-172 SS1) TaxID=930990 RepID=A0A067MRN1_BOTB1|nr:hypothetical protein BOTBODRAFT_42136 [Botryobasidium botryosum FD-172 SS1]
MRMAEQQRRSSRDGRMKRAVTWESEDLRGPGLPEHRGRRPPSPYTQPTEGYKPAGSDRYRRIAGVYKSLGGLRSYEHKIYMLQIAGPKGDRVLTGGARESLGEMSTRRPRSVACAAQEDMCTLNEQTKLACLIITEPRRKGPSIWREAERNIWHGRTAEKDLSEDSLEHLCDVMAVLSNREAQGVMRSKTPRRARTLRSGVKFRLAGLREHNALRPSSTSNCQATVSIAVKLGGWMDGWMDGWIKPRGSVKFSFPNHHSSHNHLPRGHGLLPGSEWRAFPRPTSMGIVKLAYDQRDSENQKSRDSGSLSASRRQYNLIRMSVEPSMTLEDGLDPVNLLSETWHKSATPSGCRVNIFSKDVYVAGEGVRCNIIIISPTSPLPPSGVTVLEGSYSPVHFEASWFHSTSPRSCFPQSRQICSMEYGVQRVRALCAKWVMMVRAKAEPT